MLTTTLNRIREHSPCENGWKKLLGFFGKTKADDEILPYSVILESNGLDDALWCIRAEPQYENEWRTFALKCARRVEHLHPICKTTLDVLERFINGEATREDLAAAEAAARAAAWAAESAARDAARDAARAAAWVAARAAAWDAARAAARDAAESAAWAAARAAEREFQASLFLEIVGGRQ